MKALTRLSMLLVLLFLLPVALADPPPEEDDGEVVFHEDDVLISDTASAERYRLAAQIADRAVMAYIVRSTSSIQQGHREGFSAFRSWYRARDARDRQEQAGVALLRSLMSTAVGLAVNRAFPGGSVFMEALRAYLTSAGQEALRRAGTIPSGDVNRFLDKHEEVQEGLISDLEAFPEEFRLEHPEIIEAARMEFIQESRSPGAGDASTPEIGPGTRRILRGAGVPAPGEATMTRVQEAVLTRQIRAVVATSRHGHLNSPLIHSMTAEAEAVRQLHPNDPDRYCPVEQRWVAPMHQTEECRNWRPPSQGQGE